jgi:hypothetical protein
MTQSSMSTKKATGSGKGGKNIDPVMDEMIDINGYRLNGMFQNGVYSTCPILPKFHLAYGEPIERQEVSQEFEVSKDSDPRKAQASKMLGRWDKIHEHEQSGLLIVTDDFGVNIMYDATFADMQALEGEMLRTLSFYINKVEPMTD